jgi:hypothetical protein
VPDINDSFENYEKYDNFLNSEKENLGKKII